MFISLDWISDYVDLSGIDPKEIADKLTLSTAEVEGIETINRSVAGVLIGKVLAAEPLAEKDGKKLTFCTVDCGSKTYTTVCGAPNARIGLVAPFAPAGCVLAGNKKVEKTEMSGKPSEGILCSAAELGMSDWHEIVFECPAGTKPGTPFADYVPDSDTLIEIDNKSLTHRPDLWGHYGFARELAAIFGRPLKTLPVHDLSQYDRLPEYPLAVDDLENCPAYGCVEMRFESEAVVPSPIIMQRRLHALGQRTYNLLIDVTNYVNQEIGQPTHAFDGDLISGIRVRPGGEPQKFQTLDGQERNLHAEDLLICGVLGKKTGPVDLDAAVPVALAGIMGGRATEVSDATRTVLLESANFKAGRIRRTSTRLDLRTDASQRYEKSQPPCNVRVGAERIVQLIKDAGVALTVASRFTVVGSLAEEFRTIRIEPGKLDRLAGITLPQKKIVAILTSLGFTAKYESDGTLTVGVPPFRSAKDISIPEDIVEEILRVYGYDNIEPIMPTAPLRPLFVEKSIQMEHKARKLLALSHRFIEVHNYGWTNDNWTARLGYDPGETLALRNPAAQGEARLRTSLLPNLFALVPKNRPIRDQFRLFELGHVYLPDKTTEADRKSTGCKEQARLAGVSFQQSGTTLEEHYLAIKSAIEDLGRLFGGGDFQFLAPETSNPNIPWENAGHFVEIRQKGQPVGRLGVVEKSLLEKISPEGGQIVWFEIELQRLEGDLFPIIKYAELPKFPGSWQDFSLVWDIEKGFAELEKVLDSFAHPLLNCREFVVAYKGKGLEKGTASYSFRFWIGSDDHTLSGEEIDGFHKTFLGFLTEKSIPLRG